MDAVGIVELVTIILILFLLGFNWNSRRRINDDWEYLQDQLGALEEAMAIVGAIMQKLPEMTPQFQINQNPLIQFLEFFKEMRGENQNQESLYADSQLRDDNGRFNGEEISKERTNIPKE